MTNEIVPQNPQQLTIPGEWAGELAKYAEEARQNERTAGTFFSTKGGILSFGGAPVTNNTMDVVCIGSMHERVFYPEPFGSGERQNSPLCYAFSLTGIDMKPHDEAHTKQNPTCKGCKYDEFGSDLGGSPGKGCKQMRRLALMPESALADAEQVNKATVGYLRVPVTSVKNWSAYVQTLATRALPPFAVVTRVRLVPDAKSMFKAEFTFVRPIVDGELLAALSARANNEKTLISFPYPPREDGDDKAEKGKPGTKKGKAAF